MAEVRTWAAFDVHVSGVVAATHQRDSGELRVQRLAGGSDAVVEFRRGPASGLSYYGMDSTYASSVAIMRRILKLEGVLDSGPVHFGPF